MGNNHTEKIIINLDLKTEELVDFYKRVSDIYRRAETALGRNPRYKTTISSTSNFEIKFSHVKSSQISDE